MLTISSLSTPQLKNPELDEVRAKTLLEAKTKKSPDVFKEQWIKLLRRDPPVQKIVTLHDSVCTVDLKGISLRSARGFQGLADFLDSCKCTTFKLINFPNELQERTKIVWKQVFSQLSTHHYASSVEFDGEDSVSEETWRFLQFNAIYRALPAPHFSLPRKATEVQIEKVFDKGRKRDLADFLKQPQEIAVLCPEYEALRSDLGAHTEDENQLLTRLKKLSPALPFCHQDDEIDLASQMALDTIPTVAAFKTTLIVNKQSCKVSVGLLRTLIRDELLKSWLSKFFDGTILSKSSLCEALRTTFSEDIQLNEIFANYIADKQLPTDVDGEEQLLRDFIQESLKNGRSLKVTIFHASLIPEIGLSREKIPACRFFAKDGGEHDIHLYLYRTGAVAGMPCAYDVLNPKIGPLIKRQCCANGQNLAR